jgi:heterodisulfide reductase subunit B
LAGLKVACYYGCQLVRPYTDLDDPDYPTMLTFWKSREPRRRFTAKTRCCGGSLTRTIEEVGLRLNYIILKEAKRKGADCLVTICPLCQFNLEITRARSSGNTAMMSRSPFLLQPGPRTGAGRSGRPWLFPIEHPSQEILGESR